MIGYLRRLLGLQDDSRDFGAIRSSKWPSVRAAHLEQQSTCQVTGATNDLEVHHIRPFHLHPELELDPNNLITLTTNYRGINIHLIYGHWDDFERKYNPDIVQDAATWYWRFNAKITDENP